MHVRDLLRSLVNKQDDEVHFRVVGGDAVGDILENHRLSGTRGGDNQATLPHADGRDEVDDPRGHVLIASFQLETLLRIEWGEIVEEDFVEHHIRRLEVDFFDFQQRIVTLTLLGGADVSGDAVARAQVEAADLRRRDVNVVRPRQVVVVRRPQKAKAVREGFQHARGVNHSTTLRLGL